ncbi:MAG: putative bifunctional diguanylate cyclase/phosphodiesterase, partial [Methyloligellaceae bacterium]
SLVVFLFTFLRLSLWHGWIRIAFAGWALAQLALIGLALLDARLASGLARGSFLVIGTFGTLLIVYLALRGQDRALALVPSWLLLLVWIFGATMSVFGQLSGDVVVAGLVSGLVLIVVLQAFTVTQFAFGSYEPLYGAPPSQLQLRSLAIDGAAAAVWEWNARRDEITVSNEIDEALGLAHGTLSCRVDEWLKYLHPADRERFRMLLWTIQERNGGALNLDFRMRRSDSSLLWFELRAQSVQSRQQRSLKCVGLIRDVTDARRAQQRLLRDAVHDSLTGLPNRELFLDRLETAITRATEEGANRPTVLFIDIDRFKNVNTSFGLVVGDSMLLTIARRLARHLSPLDTLARVGGDQFAIMLVTETEPRQIAMIAERVRRSLRSPMKISGKEIILTGSIGIAVYDGKQAAHQDVLREAEIAMYRAKRSGNDRVEIFKPSMRNERDDRVALESDLRRAIDRRQIRVLYQPIMHLENEQLAGFEALLRWEHPRLGTLNPADFVPIAEETGFISELGSFVLDRAARQAARWQKALPDPENPLFVSINISSRQLFRHDLIQDIRHILKRDAVPKGSVKLEVTESLVMENPEQAAEILEWLKGAGAGLSLDDFGTGYSSFNYLHRFPFDTIKVDKSLVQNAGINGSGPVIVRSIIALAHELGMDVVAEGVENAEDAKFLRSLKCEYAQGFFYGEPMTEKNVFALLNALAKSKSPGGKSKAADMLRSRPKAPKDSAAEDRPPAETADKRPDEQGMRVPAETSQNVKNKVSVN